MRRLGLVLLLSVVACQSGPSPSAVEVSLDEYEIRLSADQLQSGTVELDITNEGEFGHTVVVTDSSGDVVEAGELIGSGESSTVRVDLAPGEYRFTCRIVSQDDAGNIVDHFERGMVADVTVGT